MPHPLLHVLSGDHFLGKAKLQASRRTERIWTLDQFDQFIRRECGRQTTGEQQGESAQVHWRSGV
jgi:hypothetical protein